MGTQKKSGRSSATYLLINLSDNQGADKSLVFFMNDIRHGLKHIVHTGVVGSSALPKVFLLQEVHKTLCVILNTFRIHNDLDFPGYIHSMVNERFHGSGVEVYWLGKPVVAIVFEVCLLHADEPGRALEFTFGLFVILLRIVRI